MRRFSLVEAAILFACFLCALSSVKKAAAQFAPDPVLREQNVLLLWNPGDTESSAIAQAYLTNHPNVISFQL